MEKAFAITMILIFPVSRGIGLAKSPKALEKKEKTASAKIPLF